MNTCTASPNETSTGDQRRARASRSAPRPGRRDEEVEQHRLAARRRHEHVAAGAEPGQQRLGHERREHRRQRGVDRVAAGAQDVRAGGRGQRVAGRDDAGAGHRAPASVPRDELRHVDVAARRRDAGAAGSGAVHARLADRLAERRLRSSRGARFSP